MNMTLLLCKICVGCSFNSQYCLIVCSTYKLKLFKMKDFRWYMLASVVSTYTGLIGWCGYHSNILSTQYNRKCIKLQYMFDTESIKISPRDDQKINNIKEYFLW